MADYKGLGVDDAIAEARRRQKASDNSDLKRREAELAERERKMRDAQLQQQEEFAKNMAEMNAMLGQLVNSAGGGSEGSSGTDNPADKNTGQFRENQQSDSSASDTPLGSESEVSGDVSKSESGESSEVISEPSSGSEESSDGGHKDVSEAQEGGCKPSPGVFDGKPHSARRRTVKASNKGAGKSNKKPQNETVRQSSENDTVTAKEIPKNVMKYMESCFSGKAKYGDVVSAYAYMMSGHEVRVPERVRDFAKTWTGEVPVSKVMSRFDDLESTMRVFEGRFREIELALMFIIMQRLGFIRGQPSSAANISYMDAGYKEGISTLRTQANRFGQKEDIESHRTIK